MMTEMWKKRSQGVTRAKRGEESRNLLKLNEDPPMECKRAGKTSKKEAGKRIYFPRTY
uniref:Uncharacterized protein n=1 Tax=Arundo donax TaxID=35708 RepID=A0A0A8Y8J4_ARUDO